MGTPHKHRDVIIAWANGEEIQYLEGEQWFDYTDEWTPPFRMRSHWRIKPKRVKREGWVNLYRLGGGSARTATGVWDTKDEAIEEGHLSVACVRIEWWEE